MLELAVLKNEGQRYVLFEHPVEVEHISFEKLGYFKKVLGMSDYPGNFQSYIRRPEPLLVGCLEQNLIIGWSMFERWEKSDKDRTPIFVLRMIEVAAEYRGKKIGRHLMVLVMEAAPGHLATRPLSQKSATFFKKSGFIEPPPDISIDLQNKYGYLVLPTVTKFGVIENHSSRGLTKNTENIKRCSDGLKTQVLRQEIAKSSSFAHAFTRLLSSPNRADCGLRPGGACAPEGLRNSENKALIKVDMARVACTCGSFDIGFFTITNGDQKYMSVECQGCDKVWLTVPI